MNNVYWFDDENENYYDVNDGDDVKCDGVDKVKDFSEHVSECDKDGDDDIGNVDDHYYTD